MSKIVRNSDLRRYRAASEGRSRHACSGALLLTPTGFLGVWGCCIIKRYRTPPHDVAPVSVFSAWEQKKNSGFPHYLQIAITKCRHVPPKKAYLVGLDGRQRGRQQQRQCPHPYHVLLTSHSPTRRGRVVPNVRIVSLSA